jgi:nitroreductase
MNETLQTMWVRRSVRRYQPNPIPKEDLNLILEAARRAPTGGNRQRWQMVVVTDAELRHKTAEACNGQMWMAEAPVILCMLATPEGGNAEGNKRNGVIVLDHAILAATSLGYGTCWVGAFAPDKVKAVLGIPADYDVVYLTPVGVPAQEPAFRGRKPRAELFMADQFGTPLDYDIEE